MTMPHQDHTKSYALFALGTAVILAGIAMIFIWPDRFLFQSIGPLMLVAGACLVTLAKVPIRPSPAKPNRPTPATWAVGVLLLALTGISYFLLREDALNGGHQAWPVYLFAAVGLVCGVFWTYLLTKLTISPWS